LRLIDTAITSGRDLRQTLALVVEQAIDQLGVDAADILLFDERAGTLERVHEHLRSLAGNHLDPRVVEAFMKLLADEELSPGRLSHQAADVPIVVSADVLDSSEIRGQESVSSRE
jgi:hypothetical protein